MANKERKKILIVDDNPAIHDDFRKILSSDIQNDQLNEAEVAIFGQSETFDVTEDHVITYQVDSAYQGGEAVGIVKRSVENNDPYAVVFVDIRMPPGWDGIVTIKKIWEMDPNVQVVICTAYSDYSWKDIVSELKAVSNFLILKKPFDMVEIRQLAAALVKKWDLAKQLNQHIDHLSDLVKDRTVELEESLSLIQATFEAMPEGTIAISQNKNIVSVNQLFINQWNMSEQALKKGNLSEVVRTLADQVVESKLFEKVFNKLCENPNDEYIKEWRLRSGQVLELYMHPQTLNDKIIGSVFSFRDITQRKHLEEELLYQATHDHLTQLPNRVLLADRLMQAIANAKRYQTSMAILIIDLDNFKEVNDSFGHETGDQLLKMIANRLSQNINEFDSIIRLGGDQFIVILSDIKEESMCKDKARELLDTIVLACEINSRKIIVTGCIGISLYPKDGREPDELLRNADAALYAAKEIGRNSYQVYLSEFNEHMLQRTEMITVLRQAIENNQLFLQYQPLYETTTGEICGAEALIRWHHPQLGTVYPNTIIPLAEETGLIVSIGEWVLREACTKCKEWQVISPKLVIAINVSGYQFRQKEFINSVKKIINETGIDPKLLEFEMTESLIFKNIPETVKKMHQLKELGIKISIDDFGTGYASFSYLKSYPFDKVKIDKSFINDIHKNKNDAAIVEAIVAMSKRMGIKVVVEGVENKEQLDFLIKYHGDLVQGYYYSRPLNEEDFIKLLTK